MQLPLRFLQARVGLHSGMDLPARADRPCSATSCTTATTSGRTTSAFRRLRQRAGSNCGACASPAPPNIPAAPARQSTGAATACRPDRPRSSLTRRTDGKTSSGSTCLELGTCGSTTTGRISKYPARFRSLIDRNGRSTADQVPA